MVTESLMRSSVFVSYSRKDTTFVQELCKELTASDRSVHVDSQALMPAEEWRLKLHALILESDVFVCVLSPDFAQSTECGDEVAEAVRLNKRIVPILFREVDASTLPIALSRLNFLDMTSGIQQGSVDDLVSALDRDPEWVQAHTNIGIRAEAWEARQRDVSTLLRGSELGDVEEWLLNAAGQEPTPSRLQLDYIRASRIDQDGRRRQSRAVLTFSVAMLSTLLLAAIFLWKRSEDRERVARAQALSSLADDYSEREQPEYALTLALEATELAESYTTQSTLRRAALLPTPIAILEHTTWVEGVWFSPTDGTLVTLEPNGIRTWNIEDDQEPDWVELQANWQSILSVDIPAMRFLALTEDLDIQVVDILTEEIQQTLRADWTRVDLGAFSADGTVITASDDGYVRLWRNGQVHTNLPVGDGSLNVLALDPTGRFGAFGRSGSAHLWDLGLDQRLAEWNYSNSDAPAIFGPKGIVLTYSDSAYQVRTLDTPTSLRPGFLKNSISCGSFSSSGDIFVLCSWDGAVHVFSTASGAEIGQLLGHLGPVKSTVFSADSRFIATAGTDGTARVWSASRLEELIVLGGHEGEVKSSTFSPDGRYLATVSTDTVRLWDLERELERPRLRGASGAVYDLAFDARGRWLAASGEDRIVRVWETSTGELLAQLPRSPGRRRELAFSPQGHRLLTAESGKEICLWEMPTASQIGCYSSHMFVARGATNRFSEDGRAFVMAGHKDAELRDVEEGKLMCSTGEQASRIEDAAINFDGKSFLTWAWGNSGVQLWDAEDCTPTARAFEGESIDFASFPDASSVLAMSHQDVFHWDLSSGRQVRLYRVPEYRERNGADEVLVDAELSPGKERLLVLDQGGQARLWSVAGNLEIGLLGEASRGVRRASFSPDGSLVVTAGSDGSGHLWNATTGQEVSLLPGHSGAVLNAVISPNGLWTATASEHGEILLHPTRSVDLRALGLDRLPRNLRMAATRKAFVSSIAVASGLEPRGMAQQFQEIWEQGLKKRKNPLQTLPPFEPSSSEERRRAESAPVRDLQSEADAPDEITPQGTLLVIHTKTLGDHAKDIPGAINSLGIGTETRELISHLKGLEEAGHRFSPMGRSFSLRDSILTTPFKGNTIFHGAQPSNQMLAERVAEALNTELGLHISSLNPSDFVLRWDFAFAYRVSVLEGSMVLVLVASPDQDGNDTP